MKRTLYPTEWQYQASLISWWALACRKWKVPEYSLIAIPNGAVLAGDAKHRGIQMARLKATGLRVGTPDLLLAVPIKGKFGMEAAGLFLEMKRKPNKPSEEQLVMLDYMRGAGYDCVVAFSFDEAQRAITGYLDGRSTHS